MQHECKITVLETKVFPELQEKYLADPKSGPCPCFKVDRPPRRWRRLISCRGRNTNSP